MQIYINDCTIQAATWLDTCFIQIGTTTQFGRVHGTEADEDHPQNPLDVYSAHKVLAEQYVKIYAENFGINAYSIRLPNMYGPRATINTPALSFNNFFIGLALQEKPIPIYFPRFLNNLKKEKEKFL